MRQRAIRVAYVCGARAWGGAEIVVGTLLSGLDEWVDPVVVGVDRAVLERIAARRPGTPVVVVPEVGGKHDLAAIAAQRRALRALRPDVVQVNLPAPFAEPYSVLVAGTLPSRLVVVEHLPLPIPTRGGRVLKRLGERFIDAHVAVGSATARHVEAMLGLPRGRVRVLANGVPAPDPRPASCGRAADGFVVGAVGRLDPQKGFDVLLRAAARVGAVSVVLVGEGSERAHLERLAVRLGIGERVTITGWTDSPTRWLPAFDVVAVPSRFEGLPLVLLEAMAAGRPVVATSVGSVTDAATDGRNALLVPPDDEEALAAAIDRLRTDDALRRRLGTAAAATVAERFTGAAMARRYQDLYAELTGP